MEKEHLEICIAQGMTQRELAACCGVSHTTIRWWLKKYDLRTHCGPHGKKKDINLRRHCGCGETDPDKFYGNKANICAKCHNEYQHSKGRRQRKQAIEYLGGACSECGFSTHSCALDIHHKDPSTKDPAFKTMRYWSWDRLEKELEQCVLLCRNCHAIHHNDRA